MKLTRNEIQKEALALYKTHKFIALEWCTGLGKTKAAIDIIEEVKKQTTKTTNIIIVVAELAHIKNWQQDFNKWGCECDSIIFVTYASFKKFTNISFDLVVLDEAHHVGSDLRLDILSNIKLESLLCLSATMPKEVRENVEDSINKKLVSYKITLQEAIDAEILPEPKIHLIPMILDNTEKLFDWTKERGTKTKRIIIKCNYDDRWKYLKDKTNYPNLTLKCKCTAHEMYWSLSSEMDYYKKLFMRTRNGGIKNKWMLLGSERKRFLGSLKTEQAKAIIKTLKRKRFVCFCASIEQAELLGGKKSIHSKKKGALDTIDDFNDKKINSIYPVGMIQEGQNLVDIKAAIIVQLDGQERMFVQKSGRAMRAEEPELYIIYFKDTQDQVYLDNALSELNPDYITYIKQNV